MSNTKARPEVPRRQSPEDVRRWFQRQARRVVTFTGYSGAGYEDDARMRTIVERELSTLDPSRTIINAGATAEGIGAVYPTAKRLGFSTTGIVSSQALEASARVSDQVDHVFYVEDDTWGGFRPGTAELSPCSRAMVDVTDEFIAIGGGAIARDELSIAHRMGKPVRFFPADMNHAEAIRKAITRGQQAPPTDFSGDAEALFGRSGQH